MFCDLHVLLEVGDVRVTSGDNKLGSIGESKAEAGFRRKLRLLLEECVAEGGMAGSGCSIFVGEVCGGLAERRLLSLV